MINLFNHIFYLIMRFIIGPVLLRMLQHTMGNEAFQEGINTYLKMQ